MIRGRNLPGAKIVPIAGAEGDDELSLVAEGLMTLPSEAFDEKAFWSIGQDELAEAGVADRIAKAIAEDRDDRDSSVSNR